MSGATDTNQNDVSITVGSQFLAGWVSVSITRSLEQMPSSFMLAATEVSPLQQGQFIAKPGDPVQIKIGDDLILTGYLDRYSPAISPSQHEARLQGRSKCEDLVDSSVDPKMAGGSPPPGTVADLATRFAGPFGISVKTQSSRTMPDWAGQHLSVMLSDTPWSVIERAARYSGVLVYDDVDGNLIIADVGTESAGSDLVLGMNIQTATAEFSADQRFKDYYVVLNGMYPVDAENIDPYNTMAGSVGHATDPAVTRSRWKTIISAIGAMPFSDGQKFGQAEADWQMHRRAGRSFNVRIVTDTWRDGGGQLWKPNTVVGLDLPQLGIGSGTKWVIGTVTFLRDLGSGTTAELTIMPRDAFLPEPELDLPAAPDISAGSSNEAIGEGNTQIPQGTSAPAGGSQGFAGVPGAAGTPSGPAPQRPAPGI